MSRRLDSVSVFRCNLLSWVQYVDGASLFSPGISNHTNRVMLRPSSSGTLRRLFMCASGPFWCIIPTCRPTVGGGVWCSSPVRVAERTQSKPLDCEWFRLPFTYYFIAIRWFRFRQSPDAELLHLASIPSSGTVTECTGVSQPSFLNVCSHLEPELPLPDHIRGWLTEYNFGVRLPLPT
jgi:hypothetical protein